MYAYLDNQATTPMDPRVLEKMMPYMTTQFGNCHSQHRAGRMVAQAVEEARENVAKLINAQQKEIVFTSGATEANNIAIKGVAHYHGDKKPHVVTSRFEHKCVLESVRSLEQEGFHAHYIGVDANGRVKLDELADVLKTHDKRVSIVSIMGANNEVGTVQDLHGASVLCRAHGARLHSDCAQLAGKLPLDVRAVGVDLMSLSGHKMYGPKGVGALFVSRSRRVRLAPLISGGGQENNMRSGTLPTFLCVGFGEAARIARAEMDKDRKHCENLQKIALDEIKDMKEVRVNGSMDHRIPTNLNMSFMGVEGESLMLRVDDRVAVSSGSACTSQSLEPSHVLHAMGLPAEQAHTAIRLGFGRFTTEEEVKFAMRVLKEEVGKLRAVSVLWNE